MRLRQTLSRLNKPSLDDQLRMGHYYICKGDSTLPSAPEPRVAEPLLCLPAPGIGFKKFLAAYNAARERPISQQEFDAEVLSSYGHK